MSVRVRFAPSPTGSLHIGGARTALFNWLYARKNQGAFVLRLEDTDQGRSSDKSAQGILEGLRWLGLDWDEGPETGGSYGPYRQSERDHIYKKYLDQLIMNGKAYYCFCSSEEIQAQKEESQTQKLSYKYNRRCRSLNEVEIQDRLARGLRPVVRLAVSDTGITSVNDIIRDRVDFSNQLMDDFIIAKSDGGVTYNFAVVVDDHTMEISHVIRAEEHLSNTPKQIAIYQALGWLPPDFAHVSMILSPDRSKLSKRHGATSVQDFREAGYLPESLINYLALLGWSTGKDQDLWTLQEMVESFSLSNVSRSPAVYDLEKLTWMNGHYINKCSDTRLYSLVSDKMKYRGWLEQIDPAYPVQVISLLKTRAKTTTDLLDQAEYFFKDPMDYDPKGAGKYFNIEKTEKIWPQLVAIVSTSSTFAAGVLETAFRATAEELGLKAGDLIHPARLAISGRTSTPGLFEVMEIVGRQACLRRIIKAREYVFNQTQNKRYDI